MSEQSSEAKSSYDSAVDELFVILNDNSASESSIREVLAVLFTHSTYRPQDCQILIERWASRYEYDVDGVLVGSGAEIAVSDEIDNEGINFETEQITHKKLHFLSDVTAFLIASDNSKISDTQKERFVGRAHAFFKARTHSGWPEYLIGKAAAPYIAYNFEQAEMDNNYSERMAKGAYVLNLLRRRSLMQYSQIRRIRRLRRALGRLKK